MLLLLVSVVAAAQEPAKKYCEIIGKGSPNKSEVKIEATEGDAEAFSARSCSTMIAAVNVMANKGWKLEQSYAIVETQGMKRDVYYHYILSKEQPAPVNQPTE